MAQSSLPWCYKTTRQLQKSRSAGNYPDVSKAHLAARATIQQEFVLRFPFIVVVHIITLMMPGTLHFPVLSCARQPRDNVWLYPCLCVICVTTEMTSNMVRIGSRRVPATSVVYHWFDVECRISVVTLGKSNGPGSKQQAHFGKSQLWSGHIWLVYYQTCNFDGNH